MRGSRAYDPANRVGPASGIGQLPYIGGVPITGAAGDTFEAGKLGSYTVEDGGSVLLGDPYVFDADNIDDFDF